jgi:hypothetical protein
MTNKEQQLSLFVESVEFVEIPLFMREVNGISASQTSTKVQKNDVESTEIADLPSYFSTVSTTLKHMTVEVEKAQASLISKELCNIPQNPHFPREQQKQVLVIFDWLQIVLEEGHMEPSQPDVGRILGRPQRSFAPSSLRADFVLWCRRKGLKQLCVADSQLFFLLLDRVFYRQGSRYEFPDVEICRERFSELRSEYESATAS